MSGDYNLNFESREIEQYKYKVLIVNIDGKEIRRIRLDKTIKLLKNK